MTVLKEKNSLGLTISLILIVLAFLLGYFLHPIPNLEIQPRDSIVNYLNLIITIVVLFYIPYFIEKKLKERRAIKDYLIDDIREVVNRTEELKNAVNSYADSDETTRSDKANILGLLKMISNSNSQIRKILISVFGKSKVEEITKKLDSKSNKLWTEITGDELMTDNYEIDDEFAANTNRACLNFISSYKSEVVKINRL